MTEPDRTAARKLAADALARGDATGWFDELYALADGDTQLIPWADLCVNPNLAPWLDAQPPAQNKRALVVGCGLGDDAEHLAERGYRVTAFDIAPKAIAWCHRRFTSSPVDYQVVDALQLPGAWHGQFQLIVEIYTLQALPPELRQRVSENLAACLAPGGKLLIVARARDEHEDAGTLPWPLTVRDFEPFAAAGLRTTSFEDYLDNEDPPTRRFRVVLERPAD